MRATRAWVLVLTAMAAAPALASEGASSQSVYVVSPWLDSALTVAGTLVGATPYFIQERLIHTRCPCDPREVPAFDRWAIGLANPAVDHYALILSIAGIAPPFLVSLIDLGPRDTAFWEDFIVMGEALALSFAACTLVKFTTQRPIPRVFVPGQDPVAEVTPGGYRAFYSGHVAMAVTALTAGAMTWTYRYGPSWWPWALDATVGVLLSTGVILSGGHYISDVVVGAGAAVAFGVLVPMLHRRERGPRISLAPAARGDGGLLALSATF